MPLPGNLLTTAMAVMPHTDVSRALEMALSLDVPFWPQLPNFSYYEDMYVQAAEHFPGIILDVSKRTLRFSIDRFAEEFEETLARFDDPEYFDVSETYSAVYHRFLSLDQFFAQVDRPRGIHLCGNPDWDFLLNLDLEVLSMDIYTNAENRNWSPGSSTNMNALAFLFFSRLNWTFNRLAMNSSIKGRTVSSKRMGRSS